MSEWTLDEVQTKAFLKNLPKLRNLQLHMNTTGLSITNMVNLLAKHCTKLRYLDIRLDRDEEEDWLSPTAEDWPKAFASLKEFSINGPAIISTSLLHLPRSLELLSLNDCPNLSLGYVVAALYALSRLAELHVARSTDYSPQEVQSVVVSPARLCKD